MRKGYDSKWIYLPNGDLAGIALGSDSCAEHEMGVDVMRRKFGCDSSKTGVEKRQATIVPADLQWLSDPAYSAIFLTPKADCYRSAAQWVKDHNLKPNGQETFGCAWDEKSFGIVGYGEKDKKNLTVLWAAFQAKDIAFWPNIGVFLQGGGLIFCIVSKVPDADKRKMLADDRDYVDLCKQAAETGIEAELNAAGRKFFALSPKWAKNVNHAGTKYPVVFWLNPQEQDVNNFGWWTVEQLREWAQGRGPIIKTRKQRVEWGRP